jgi:osmoprotectant transport system permease protein
MKEIKSKKLIFILLIMLIYVGPLFAGQPTVKIGAKHFNEGYLLAEMLAQIFEINDFQVERKFNLGGTLICFEALRKDEIDIYPEYSGTITEQILKVGKKLEFNELRDQLLNKYNLEMSESFGFNNTYALAVKNVTGDQYDLNTISDLRFQPQLQFAFSYEFLKREDGWEKLAAFYLLPQKPVGIEHGLSYQALDQGKIDLIDIYSTDGEISRYNLKILKDDLNFFPEYKAVALFRRELSPEVKSLIAILENSLNEEKMQQLNSRVVFNDESHSIVARSFLLKTGLVEEHQIIETGAIEEIFDKTIVHLGLTGIALLAAVMIAIPLGVMIYRHEQIARPVLYFSGLLQTIPSIALLALMIPLFGIGVLPAVVALFLYALLPILRNTATALFSIDPLLKKVATGIGLTPWQRLRYVEIPLSTPTIFAGIKTAAVISIGTATLAAFIGAGGLGEFIVTGLALNNTTLILKGAIPAALLAILVEFIFELIEKFYVPKHLQEKIGK